MITWIVRILCWIICILCIMSGHWIWGIIFALPAIGFYVNVNGKRA